MANKQRMLDPNTGNSIPIDDLGDEGFFLQVEIPLIKEAIMRAYIIGMEHYATNMRLHIQSENRFYSLSAQEFYKLVQRAKNAI